MNENVPNPQIPTEPPQRPVSIEQKSSGIGPLIAIIVILLVIVAGGLYFCLKQDADTITPEDVQQQTGEQPDQFQDVEADLNTQEFSDIDIDLNSIDQEF